MRSTLISRAACGLACLVALGCGRATAPPATVPPVAPSPISGAPPPAPQPTVLGDASVLDSVHVPYGAPVDADPSDDYLMDKGSYVLSYNPKRSAANWVGWRVRAEDLGDAERQDDFRADPSLPAAFQRVGPDDYRGSGFDRGHLCPSADRTRTVEDNASTFLMTNMHPQTPQLNRGPWKSLESYTRSLVEEGKVAYVVAGGLFGGKMLGNGVSVPVASYKVVLAVDEGAPVTPDTMVLSVIMPNDASVKGHKWHEYAVTVDELEARSGYDVLSKLDDEVERKLEMVSWEPGAGNR